MDVDLNKAASELLKTPAGARLAGKKDDLQKLINTPEGQNVKNMLSGDAENLKAAIAGGDMDTLKKTLAQILNTEDGAKLATQIQNLMK